MKEYTYLKIRVDFNKPMTSEEVEEFVEDMGYELKDSQGRINSSELIETTEF